MSPAPSPRKHNAPGRGRCRGTVKGLGFEPSPRVLSTPQGQSGGRMHGTHRQDKMLPDSRAFVLTLPVVERPTFNAS